jgi:hypothetical protein
LLAKKGRGLTQVRAFPGQISQQPSARVVGVAHFRKVEFQRICRFERWFAGPLQFGYPGSVELAFELEAMPAAAFVRGDT